MVLENKLRSKLEELQTLLLQIHGAGGTIAFLQIAHTHQELVLCISQQMSLDQGDYFFVEE
jgi:ABC-type molybdenum transport system ATPase subunit/photorepair protein PhrA